MKALAIGALGFVAFTSMALAQAVVVGPEDETVVREYVTREHVRPIEPPAGFEVREGVDLPDTVELREVPKLRGYRTAVIGKRTVIVEPRTRRVIRVIE